MMFSIFGIKDYIFASIVVSFGIYVGFQKYTIAGLETDNELLKSDKVRYENSLNIAQEQAKEKVITVTKEVEVVKWKTQTKIKTIKEYVRDENQTDCQNALSFARSYF